MWSRLLSFAMERESDTSWLCGLPSSLLIAINKQTCCFFSRPASLLLVLDPDESAFLPGGYNVSPNPSIMLTWSRARSWALVEAWALFQACKQYWCCNFTIMMASDDKFTAKIIKQWKARRSICHVDQWQWFTRSSVLLRSAVGAREGCGSARNWNQDHIFL